MKELRYNLRYLLHRKELYISIIIMLLISVAHFVLNIKNALPTVNYPLERFRSAEYQYILNNNTISLAPFIIIGFPLLSIFIFSDSSWEETKSGIYISLNNRLNRNKNIATKYILSIVVSFILVLLVLLFNYLLHRIVFYSGNTGDLYGSLAYNLVLFPGKFLDDIRLTSPTIYSVLCCVHIAVLCSLMAGLSYSLSFYIKNKAGIFFQCILFMLALQLITSIFKIEQFSIITQMNIGSIFSIFNSFFMYIILLFLGIFALVPNVLRKDKLN